MKYIIRFEDGDNTYPFMCEDEDGTPTEERMVFDTKEEAGEYLKTLDEREFKRWVEEENDNNRN